MLTETELAELVKLRRELHKYPELSGKEKETADRIIAFLNKLEFQDLKQEIGGYGILVTFSNNLPGPRILVRADMDALPIAEQNVLPYSSEQEHVAHLCGHDGHVTIALGLATELSKSSAFPGTVSILFQPAEETGEGAALVLSDPVFSSLHFDMALALHNLPGFNRDEVVVKDGTFACASQGLRMVFEGKTSHAAEPENGISPLDASMEFLSLVRPYSVVGSEPFRLATVVHMRLGDEAFGVSPGTAVVALTLRAETDELLGELKETFLDGAKVIADDHHLTWSFTDVEPFAATVNEEGFAGGISACARELGLKTRSIDKPFRWSEDAGLLIRKFGGGFFGLGAGSNMPALHNPSYDFPDELITTGVDLFTTYIRSQQKEYAENVTH